MVLKGRTRELNGIFIWTFISGVIQMHCMVLDESEKIKNHPMPMNGRTSNFPFDSSRERYGRRLCPSFILQTEASTCKSYLGHTKPLQSQDN
jgi:hypothetical protein